MITPNMDPNTMPADLEKRQFGYGGYRNGYYGRSRWSSWGRWVLLGGIIIVFIALFLVCSCITARKRRRRGAQPMYGTGWMANGHGPVNYYPNSGQQQPQQQQTSGYYSGYNQSNNYDPAPQYNQYGGNNAGYYGSSGVQQPDSTYQPQRGGDPVYSPPAGAPPTKGDVVR